MHQWLFETVIFMRERDLDSRDTVSNEVLQSSESILLNFERSSACLSLVLFVARSDGQFEMCAFLQTDSICADRFVRQVWLEDQGCEGAWLQLTWETDQLCFQPRRLSVAQQVSYCCCS